MNRYRDNVTLRNQKPNIAKGDSPLSASAVPSFVFALIAAACSITPAALFAGSQISEIISITVCIICAACIAVTSKKFSLMIIATIFASMTVSFSGSTVPVAIMFGSLCSVAFGASAIAGKQGKALLPALFIFTASYTLSFLISKDAAIASIGLCTLPTMLTLGIANRKSTSKTTAVILGTIASTAVTVALLSSIIFIMYGSLSVASIRNASSDLAYTVEYYVKAAIHAAGNTVTPDISSQIIELGDTFINALPGTIVALAFVHTYICQSMVLAISDRLGEDTSSRNSISASMVTALIFILAYLVSFTTSASGKVAFIAVVANNIAIILTPCLVIVGFRALKLMPFKLGLIGLLLSGAAIVLIFISFQSAFTIVALTGAAYTLIDAVDAWAKDHYSKGESK